MAQILLTHEVPVETPTLAARKQWLADHLQVRGKISLDAGAVKALTQEGKSLLPIGAIALTGEFERGAVVSVYRQQRQGNRARLSQLQRRRDAQNSA